VAYFWPTQYRNVKKIIGQKDRRIRKVKDRKEQTGEK